MKINYDLINKHKLTERLYGVFDSYVNSSLLIVSVFIIYCLSLILIGSNVKTLSARDILKLLLLFLLFISNYHLFLTAKMNKDRFNRCLQAVSINAEDARKYLSWRNAVLFVLCLIFIFIYIYVPYHEYQAGTYKPLLYLDVIEQPYQVYDSAGPSIADTTKYIDNIYLDMFEINETLGDLCSVVFMVDNNSRDNASYNRIKSNFDANKRLLNDTYSEIEYLHSMENQITYFSIFSPEFSNSSIYNDINMINNTPPTYFYDIRESARYYSKQINRSHFQIARLAQELDPANSSQQKVAILCSVMDNVTKIIETTHNGISSAIISIDNASKYHIEADNSGRLMSITIFFDIFSQLVSLLMLSLFLFNFCIILDLLHRFISAISRAEPLDFSHISDLGCVDCLRDFKKLLYGYILYYTLILSLSTILYVMMSEGARGIYSPYIEALLISLYTFIILILSSISFRKMSSFISRSVDSGIKRLEVKMFFFEDNNYIDKFGQRRTILKDIEDEFSTRQNLLSYLSTLAPLASLILSILAFD